MKNTFLFVTLMISLMTGACAPKVQDSDKKHPGAPELQTHDIALQQTYTNPFASVGFAIKKMNLQKINTQTSIQNLFEIGQQLSDQNSIERAIENFNHQSLLNLQKTKKFEQTYYLQLVEEQTKDVLKKSTSDVEKKILSDTDAIEKLITDTAYNSENKLNPENSLRSHIEIAQKLIENIILKIQAADFFPDLKKQIIERLNSESTAYLKTGLNFDSEYSELKSLTDKLNLVNTYLKKIDVQLSAENQSALLTGQQLGLSIDRISNPQNALQTLAFTWQILTIEERIQHFQSANQSLYDLLNKKSDPDIQCLIDGNCSGLIVNLVLNLGVYPELEKYGVEKIKADLNHAATGFLSRKISLIVFEKIGELPATIQTQIRSSVEKNIGALQDFKDNFKINLAVGLQKKLNTTELNFYVTSKSDIRLHDQIPLMTNDLYAITHSEAKNNQLKQFLLIEKVISLLDFSNNQKNNLKNGLSAFLKNPKELFLMSTLQSPMNSLQVKDQAATLKFLSLMVTATADWKTGPFDHGITDIRVQDLISELKSDQLNQPLFPRIELFNICFSYAVQVLKQIQSEKSLIYLIDNNNQRIPIMDYLSGKNHPTVALGAASDLINNRSANTTKIADLALLIDALAAFSTATKDVNNSKSSILKNPDIQSQITNANKNIELLVLTLANFISSQMIGPKNLVDDSYDFDTQTLIQNYKLSNQVAAISALIKAYEASGIDLYLLSAKELYYALNKNYFDPELKFYKNNLSDKSNSDRIKDDVLNTLNQLIPLRKYLNLSSQVQFDRIFENWYVAVLL